MNDKVIFLDENLEEVSFAVDTITMNHDSDIQGVADIVFDIEPSFKCVIIENGSNTVIPYYICDLKTGVELYVEIPNISKDEDPLAELVEHLVEIVSPTMIKRFASFDSITDVAEKIEETIDETVESISQEDANITALITIKVREIYDVLTNDDYAKEVLESNEPLHTQSVIFDNEGISGIHSVTSPYTITSDDVGNAFIANGDMVLCYPNELFDGVVTYYDDKVSLVRIVSDDDINKEHIVLGNAPVEEESKSDEVTDIVTHLQMIHDKLSADNGVQPDVRCNVIAFSGVDDVTLCDGDNITLTEQHIGSAFIITPFGIYQHSDNELYADKVFIVDNEKQIDYADSATINDTPIIIKRLPLVDIKDPDAEEFVGEMHNVEVHPEALSPDEVKEDASKALEEEQPIFKVEDEETIEQLIRLHQILLEDPVLNMAIIELQAHWGGDWKKVNAIDRDANSTIFFPIDDKFVAVRCVNIYNGKLSITALNGGFVELKALDNIEA